MKDISFFTEKLYKYGTKQTMKKGRRIFWSKEKGGQEPILFLDSGVCALCSLNKKGEESVGLYFKGPRLINSIPYLIPERLDKLYSEDLQICITAKTNCVLYKLPEDIFYQLLSENPQFIKYTMTILAENCMDVTHHLAQLQQEGNDKKLCCLLLKYAEWKDGKLVMPSYFTYEELSDYLGIHPVTVARELLKLKSSGYIGRAGRLIQILDPEALKKILMEV